MAYSNIQSPSPKIRLLPAFRLKITQIPAELEKEIVEGIFSEFGKVTGVQIIKQKTGGNLGYVSFSNYKEAELAINSLNDKLPLQLKVEFQDDSIRNLHKKSELNECNHKENCLGSVYNCKEHKKPIDEELYEIAPEVEEENGICKVCSTSTAFKCHQCEITYYCSKNCQIEDWSKHKFECQPVPPLVKKKSLVQYSTTPKNSSYDNIDVKDSVPQNSKLHLDEKPSTCTPSKDCHEKNLSEPAIKIHEETEKQKKDFKSSNDIYGNHTDNYTSVENKAISNGFISNQGHSPSQNLKKEALQDCLEQPLNKKLTITDDDISFQSAKTFLPRDKFEKVMITVALGHGQYWVQKVKDNENLIQLFEKLRDYANNQQLVKPIENVKCVLEFAQMWYRATILSITGSTCQIFFHDFGTVDEGIVTKVVRIDDFDDLPFFSRRIQLCNNSDAEFYSLKGDDFLLVKTLSVGADGLIVVQAGKSNEGKFVEKKKNIDRSNTNSIDSATQPSKNKSEISKSINLPNILDKLKVGLTGIIIFNASMCQGEFNVTLVPEEELTDYGNLLEELKMDCLSELTKEPNYRPRIGELVCGQSLQGEWYRGIILSLNPDFSLAAIDEARIFNPVKVVPIPKNYDKIYSFGVICKFTKDVSQYQIENLTGQFEVLKYGSILKSALVQITIDDSEFSSQAIINKWNNKLHQVGIKEAQLKSGNKVIISEISNDNLVFVRSQESEDIIEMDFLDRQIAKLALKRKPLSEAPIVGQMVLAQYLLDGNFYRALITEIKNDKIMIVYVDYGNEEPATIEKLFDLPEELKQYASCVSKIKFKDVHEQAIMNPKVYQYLSELAGEKVVLRCTFTGHPLEEGVILKTLNDESVNTKINSLLNPTEEKQILTKEKKVYGLEDLPILKLGDVGDQVHAILLHYYESNGSMIFGPSDVETAEAIQNDLAEKIEKYVASTSDCYVPQDHELCIAQYGGFFYRALCLDHKSAPDECLVFFIDYGNSERVKHQDIRMFTEDFAKIGAYGILCNIHPMVPQDKFNDKIAKKIRELAPINDIYTIKIIDIDEDLAVNIDIPDIHAKLIEEKFL